MGEILRILKVTAIFMLTAQVLLRLGPGKKYEKYTRMIASLVILSQLAFPILSLGSGKGAISFQKNLERIDQENEDFVQRMELLSRGQDGMLLEGMAASVEERLADEAARVGVRIRQVSLEGEKLLITVEEKKQDIVIEPIRIGTEEETQVLGEARVSYKKEELAEIFAQRLGMPENGVEVIALG